MNIRTTGCEACLKTNRAFGDGAEIRAETDPHELRFRRSSTRTRDRPLRTCTKIKSTPCLRNNQDPERRTPRRPRSLPSRVRPPTQRRRRIADMRSPREHATEAQSENWSFISFLPY